MYSFSGFPAGKQPLVKVPHAFWTELLPAINDLAELKVTLHCLWLLTQKQGELRYTRLAEIAADDRFMAGLASKPEEALTVLRHGLELAESRGTLLKVQVRENGREDHWYFLNSELGRAAVMRIRRGELTGLADLLPEDISLQTQRPHIFLLYEQNIGLIQPMLAEELRDAERTYPQNWLEEAFRIAVELNVRNWKYVRTILERWAAEGKDHGSDKRDAAQDDSYEALKRRYVPDEYEDIIEH
ncbi:MAG: DnaD domain protein [Caldilineales bacterium]